MTQIDHDIALLFDRLQAVLPPAEVRALLARAVTTAMVATTGASSLGSGRMLVADKSEGEQRRLLEDKQALWLFNVWSYAMTYQAIVPLGKGLLMDDFFGLEPSWTTEFAIAQIEGESVIGFVPALPRLTRDRAAARSIAWTKLYRNVGFGMPWMKTRASPWHRSVVFQSDSSISYPSSRRPSAESATYEEAQAAEMSKALAELGRAVDRLSNAVAAFASVGSTAGGC